jgi:hypothetical protein
VWRRRAGALRRGGEGDPVQFLSALAPGLSQLAADLIAGRNAADVPEIVAALSPDRFSSRSTSS